MANAESEHLLADLSANLASFCIESLMCGMFDCLGLTSLYLLHIRKHSEHGKRPPLSISIYIAYVTLLVAVTTHWVVSICRLFLGLGSHGAQEAVEYFADIGQSLHVAQVSIVALCVLIGDAVLVFRLWVVWSYNRAVVAAPLGALVMLLGGTIASTEAGYRENDGLTSKHGKWATGGLVCTLCTTVYCSCMIAGMLLRADRRTKRTGAPSIMFMAWLPIFIESAAFYTAWTLFYTITYEMQSAARYIGIGGLPAAAGIACRRADGKGHLSSRHGYRNGCQRAVTTTKVV
ncbi:uncharacterized protein C8Q71DRAFT_573863 [Rhodofomes roseus]|uniref:Uncharacterized protein n=1 Tax=Rhodofomes roseus TaxID=34475 RepID=A0ABQ8KJ34_9APHY|nr:uncharacterized protein C8Q71DRAFT_573863 [Rhodofomes roseus]KAH9838021.1 hypothetical protein C8Q71DRAFT_573863 [Rhodofomes roseus]